MNFDKKIALFNIEVETKEDAIKIAYEQFKEYDLVNDTFIEGVLTREGKYPTGLLLENGIGVAIPHTDPEHVKSSQIGFISLKNSVKFCEMVNPESEIDVKFIFVLALKEAHAQLETLQGLMGLFMDSNLVNRLIECSDVDAYFEILKEANILV